MLILNKLITKALKNVDKFVQEEIQWREDLAKSTNSFNSRVTSGHNTIIIDNL